MPQFYQLNSEGTQSSQLLQCGHSPGEEKKKKSGSHAQLSKVVFLIPNTLQRDKFESRHLCEQIKQFLVQ